MLNSVKGGLDFKKDVKVDAYFKNRHSVIKLVNVLKILRVGRKTYKINFFKKIDCNNKMI